MADALTAELAAIQDRSKQGLPNATSLPISHPAVRRLIEISTDVPRLAAAVEAVLAIHRPDCEMGVDAVWCRAEGPSSEWPCPTYVAISAVLTAGVRHG